MTQHTVNFIKSNQDTLTMIKKMEDGRWYVDIQPGGRGHKRYQRKFRTKAEARRFELFITQKVEQDHSFVLASKDHRRLQEFVRLWYDNTGRHLSSGPDTFNRMIQAASAMGSPIMRTFKPVIFLEYRSKRIEQGISPATMNRELMTFKAVFNDLLRSGQFEGKNPFLAIRLIRTHQPKTIYLTEDQIRLLFDALK